jgi:hypothetical protein
MIERYNFCTKINCQAFPGSYDQQPAEWIDFVNILNNELIKIAEWQKKG